jgi:hypothetical protein
MRPQRNIEAIEMAGFEEEFDQMPTANNEPRAPLVINNYYNQNQNLPFFQPIKIDGIFKFTLIITSFVFIVSMGILLSLALV